MTRRDILKRAAFAGMLLPMAGALPALRAEADPQSIAPAGARLSLGLATYSLRKLPTDEAIKALGELGITRVSLFRVHMPIVEGTPDGCRAIVKKFTDAGITVTGTGVVTLKNTEGAMRRAFECGKAAGLTTMTASYAVPPDKDALLLTERFVREYDIRLAFHNHGPEDIIFPSPYDVMRAVEPYDERMGLCIDVGHSARAGVDPAEAIVKCRSRLYAVHLKDTAAGVGVKKDVPVVLGNGRLDLRAIMEALLQIRYSHQVDLEYEVDSPDPVPGIGLSFGYMRGMLDALAPKPLLYPSSGTSSL
jgi:sugar phosphate isomerase/epimerase